TLSLSTMATKLFSPSLSCPWVTSRDVVIKGRRRDFVTKRNRVTAMVVEPLTAVSSSAVQIHQWWEQNTSSLLLMAETGGGYSLASYYTSLGLFFRVFGLSSNAPLNQRFEGTMVPSRGQAALLTFCTCISLASVGLVLTITLPDFGNNWFFITILSPLAGAYYWKKASRKEEIKVKMMVGENGKLNEVVVQGDDVQVEEMRKELQFSEKGMVYVKGLFERS
ncbi:hypothetical protein HID58_023884, partial [Brassica napus]